MTYRTMKDNVDEMLSHISDARKFVTEAGKLHAARESYIPGTHRMYRTAMKSLSSSRRNLHRLGNSHGHNAAAPVTTQYNRFDVLDSNLSQAWYLLIQYRESLRQHRDERFWPIEKKLTAAIDEVESVYGGMIKARMC